MTPERRKEIERLLADMERDWKRKLKKAGSVLSIREFDQEIAIEAIRDLLAEVKRLEAIEQALQKWVLNSAEFWDVVQRVGYVEPTSRSAGKRIDE